VTNWIKNKFLSWGFTNVELDPYFAHNAMDTSISAILNNVVATLEGTSKSKEVIVIGAHFDSMVHPQYSYDDASGADDNASGTAAVLECARVIMKQSYRPNLTIKFVTYNGEESSKPSGSNQFANHLYSEGYEVRLAINSDMIATNRQPLNISKVELHYCKGFEKYRDLVNEIAKRYTVINITEREGLTDLDNSGYHDHNDPAVGLAESDFSNYYHTPNDLLVNCDMGYCKEVIKIACGCLISSVQLNSQLKSIQLLIAEPDWSKINLHWKPETRIGSSEFNIYRGLTQQDAFVKINTSLVIDTVFIDDNVQNGIYYYYQVRAIDSLGVESMFNPIIKSRSVSLDSGILLVDETMDGTSVLGSPSDEEVDSFYVGALTDFKFKQYDVIKEGDAMLYDLGQYSTVIWQGNDYINFTGLAKSSDEIRKYLQFGGNFFFNGYYPIKAFSGKTGYPINSTPGEFVYDILKIKKSDLKFSTRFSGAISMESGYPPMFVDSTKSLSNYSYHLNNIESLEPAPDGKVIYKYESKFDTSTSQGSMKGLPVGVEYIGTDYKLVTLSFPLYFMKSEEAKQLMQYVLLNKFNEPTGIAVNSEIAPDEFSLSQNYPNPFNPTTNIDYDLPTDGKVTLKIYDMLGCEVMTLVDEYQQAGRYNYEVGIRNYELSSGVYFYQLRAGSFVQTKKMILMK